MNKKEFKKLVKIDANGCWNWTRSTRSSGYAQCSKCDEPTRMADKLAYKLYIGDPGNFLILHKCDNTLCVNPKHLFLGTHKDNSQDMVQKKRYKHPAGRPYNTLPARQALIKRYEDVEFVKTQGNRIAAGFAANREKRRPVPCAQCGTSVFPIRANNRFCSTKCKTIFNRRIRNE